MESNQLKSVFFLALAITVANCQDFCVAPTPAGNMPVPTIGNEINGRFQATIELNKAGSSEEIVEFYDGLANIGIAIQRINGNTIRSYAYYGLNEGYFISDEECTVLKLNESNPNGIFQTIIVDGQQHILSPLNTLTNNNKLNFVYIGDRNSVRGIPVDEWQACYKSPTDQTNIRYTISFSSSRWSTASQTPVPVQILVESKAPADNQATNEVYSITQFRPFLSIDEEAYFTPDGIYCPNRKSEREIPEIYQHIRFTNQISTPYLLDSYELGTIETFHEEYSYYDNLFKITYDSSYYWLTEIHDYNTGTNYKINRFTGECSTATLSLTLASDSSSYGNILFLRSPNQLFDIFGYNLQYTGVKKRNGVLNDAYIGRGSMSGYNVTVDWYFLSKFWQMTNQDSLKKKYQLPILAKFYFKDPITQITQKTIYNQFFNFQMLDYFNPDDFDITLCVRNHNQRHFWFTIENENLDIIKKNEIPFRQTLVYFIQAKAGVTILRVSDLQISYDFDSIKVLFTLLERVREYGPVELPSEGKDVPLSTAVGNLIRAFEDQKKMTLSFILYKESGTETVKILARKDSLKEIEFEHNGYVTFNRDMTTNGISNVIVGITTTLVAVLGVVVGVVLTYIFKVKKVQVPFINKIKN